jgi:hypothetical protein
LPGTEVKLFGEIVLTAECAVLELQMVVLTKLTYRDVLSGQERTESFGGSVKFPPKPLRGQKQVDKKSEPEKPND